MWAVAIMGGCTHHPSPSAGVGERVAPPLRGVGGMGTPPGTRGVGTPLPGTGPEPGFSDEDCILVYDHKHKTGGGSSPLALREGWGEGGVVPGNGGWVPPFPHLSGPANQSHYRRKFQGKRRYGDCQTRGGQLPLPQRGWGVPLPLPEG